METKTYSSKSNAKRAFTSAMRRLDDFEGLYLVGEDVLDVSYNDEESGQFVKAFKAVAIFENTPAEFPAEAHEAIGGAVEVRYEPRIENNEASDEESTPKATRDIKPFETWDRSEVDSPVATAHSIFDGFAEKSGKDHSRKDAIAAAVEAGVNKNTAATQYRVWREKKGYGTRSRG